MGETIRLSSSSELVFAHTALQSNPSTLLPKTASYPLIPAIAFGVFRDLGSGADEQCQRIGGGYKAVTFGFLLFL